MLRGNYNLEPAGSRTWLRKAAHWLKYPCLAVFLVFALFPAFSKVLFLGMPGPSADFDCDDATLYMQDRLSRLGIESTVAGGDMGAPAGSFFGITHVWLMADFGGVRIPFDWGAPQLDQSYFKGYPLTREQLVWFVDQDKRMTSIPSSHP